MEFPEDIVHHIKGFAPRPKLKTKDEWVEFYLSKTPPLRYKVGMKFKFNDSIHTITVIEPTHMLTNDKTKYTTIWPTNYGDIFRYKDIEHYRSLPWTSLMDDSISSKKKIYITNALNYIQKKIAIEKGYSITNKNKYHQLLWRDFNNNYKEWGAIVSGT